MPSTNPSSMILPTSSLTIPATTFYVLNWIFCALCVVAFAMRAYIRYVSFHKFLFEDYLMLVAVLLHTGEAVLIQLYARYAYDQESVGRGDLSKIGPDFLKHIRIGLISFGTSINITMVGVLLIKLNFLLFFRRLGENINRFKIAWWTVLLFTVAGTLTQIAMQQFGCFFADITYIMSEHCANSDALKHVFINSIYSAVVDAVSDVLIVGLPVAILWRSHIDRKKKVMLSLVFGLVFITIAITIVRGSVFHSVYQDVTSTGKVEMQSTTFTWFWFYCEFTVAILIACIVSFRTLFVQRRNEAGKRDRVQYHREQHYRSVIRRGIRARARQYYDSVLDTCKTLEGVSSNSVNPRYPLPTVPSGTMTVDFEDDGNWRKIVSQDDSVNGKPTLMLPDPHLHLDYV